MKNARLGVAVVLTLCILLLALDGCGGEASRAKGFMEQGDAQLVKMKPISARLTKITNTLYSGVFAGGKVDAAGFQKNSAEVVKAADELAAAASVAEKKYAGINSLKTVTGYKKYADLQVKALGLNEQGLTQLKSFLARWTPAIAAAGFDPVAFVGAAKELSTQSTAIADQIEKLETEAAQVKKSEKL
ncbi:MAG: hypothetical protein ACYC99_09410 [Candidatus Geothermincolia bacterium]